MSIIKQRNTWLLGLFVASLEVDGLSLCILSANKSSQYQKELRGVVLTLKRN